MIFIPLVIYYIYQKKKEKKLLSFDTIFLVCLLLFIGLLTLGVKFEKVSEYFLMKNYYALWLVLIYINFKALMYIFEKTIEKWDFISLPKIHYISIYLYNFK